MEKVIEDVAVFKKPTTGTGKCLYELKPEMYEMYNVFHYHYSKEEQSRSVETLRKMKKEKNLPQCNPPPPPPKFTKEFQSLTGLMTCELFHHVLSLVLHRADNLKSRSFSENQVHR